MGERKGVNIQCIYFVNNSSHAEPEENEDTRVTGVLSLTPFLTNAVVQFHWKRDDTGQ